MNKLDSFIVIDLETTGLDPKNDEIIEIGAVCYTNGVPGDTYSQLIRPSKEIPDEIVRLTGISNEMVENAPKIEDVFDDFKNFIRDDYWIVGQNIEFDLSFLKKIFDKKYFSDLENKSIDTAGLARTLYPTFNRYNLRSLLNKFNIKIEDPHRALSDSLATAKVYLLLLKKLFSISISQRESITRMLFGLNKLNEIRESINELSLEIDTEKVDSKDDEEKYLDNVFGKSPLKEYNDYITIDQTAIENHFLPGGILAKKIGSYEYRPQQVQFSANISNAFNRSEFLVAEAPTGIGKSIAYLLPASWWASLNGEQVIISTQTKSLQSQLFYKDIPQLRKAVGYDFKSVILKGRGNYLCLYRFNELKIEAEISFSKKDRESLLPLILWVEQTKTGDISECNGFNPALNYHTWNRISCEGSFCLGQGCKFANQCFLLKIKNEVQKAQLVVVNHYLTFADFASGGDLIRNSGNVIFDESHNLEKVAASYLGNKLEKRTFEIILSDMYNSKPTQSGFLIALKLTISKVSATDENLLKIDSVIDAITGLRSDIDLFFNSLSKSVATEKNNNNKEILYNAQDNPFDDTDRTEFIDSIKGLIDRLNILLDSIHEIDDFAKKRDTIIRLESFRSDLVRYYEATNDLLFANDNEYVYWIERSEYDRFPPRLYSAPLDVGKLLDEKFYDYLHTIIFTSATITVDNKFDYFLQRLGLNLSQINKTLTCSFESPFDIDSNVAVISASYLPSPKSSEFENQAKQTLLEILSVVSAKTMVLFTSYNALRASAEYIKDTLEKRGIQILIQRGSYNSERILNRFKLSKKAVLLGTDTFWEGVDLPGKYLELLILYKLPFTVPDRPWFKENLKRIEQRGENPFLKLSLPDAVVKFRQGFGRLIRKTTDRGCVVVLDSRVDKSFFGRIFLNSVKGTKIKCKSAEEIKNVIADWL